ncbi:histidine phosphatase family protein [Kineosporia sp. A_224]|uniref:histidine phosphatase family protein n=1 Tax=Kineosporia sp. A_224 TaxID=1962180 RepID=UPI000B4ACAE6|nr:histidine phosphatase family protein [Kineosporia sp. A_224]
MTEVLLHVVRHAEPGYASDSEEPSAGLSARGRAQADALGARLRDRRVDAVLHGPLARARETAERLAAAAGCAELAVTAHLDDRTPLPRDVTEAPEPYRRFVTSAAAAGGDEVDPDGEALDAAVAAFSAGAAARTVSLLLGEGPAAGRPPGAPLRLVLVTHAFVVGWFVRHALDAPRWRWMGLNPSHASLTVLHLRDGVPANLLGFDDLGHLTPDLRSGVVVDRS